MAVNGNFLKLYSMIGIHRNLLSSRIILPIYQPIALKQTIEERAGLPAKPKKPLSPYFQFMKNIRPTITEKNPNLKVTEVTKLLAQEWRKTDEKLRKELRKNYEINLEKYQIAKTEYYNSFTAEQKQELEKLKLELKYSKQKKVQQQTFRSLGKPKRPASAFAMWCATLGSRRGSTKLSEWQKCLVSKWEALPKEEKEQFQMKAAEAMKVYMDEQKKWQDKMIAGGNYDLVRYGRKLNQHPTEKKKGSQ